MALLAAVSTGEQNIGRNSTVTVDKTALPTENDELYSGDSGLDNTSPPTTSPTYINTTEHQCNNCTNEATAKSSTNKSKSSERIFIIVVAAAVTFGIIVVLAIKFGKRKKDKFSPLHKFVGSGYVAWNSHNDDSNHDLSFSNPAYGTNDEYA